MRRWTPWAGSSGPATTRIPKALTACTPTGAFPTEDGRARLLYTAPRPLPEPPDDEYPFVPFHFAEQCVNQLTLPAFCPKSREPNYKQCAVRIEKTTTK